MAKKGIWKFISYLLVLLVVLGVAGVIAHFTNGFTSDFKTFYVTVNGKDVMTSASGYEISETQPLEVGVKYTLDFVSKEASGYSVKIVPNKAEGKNFDYTVNGAIYSFFGEKDLTMGFNVSKSEKSFTVTPKGGTVTDVIKKIYAGKAVSDCEPYVYEDMFTLIVTSMSGESSVSVSFSITGEAQDVTFDKGVMVF